MSIRAIDWALNQKCGSPAAKLVLIKLADNANDAGTCYPSLDHIEKHTELSRSAIKANIKRLVDLGLVQVEHRRHDTVQLSNVYYLNLSSVKNAPAGGVGLEQTGGRAAEDPGVGRQKTPNRHLEPSLNQEEYILPSFVPKERWAEFLAHRKRKKAPVTKEIAERLFDTLRRLLDHGHDPGEVIAEAIDRNWTGIKFDWIHKDGPAGGGMFNDGDDSRQEEIDKIWAPYQASSPRTPKGLPNA